MRTSVIFMLAIQGAVALITCLLYRKVLTMEKRKEGKKGKKEK